MDLKQALKGKLSEKELEALRKSFDSVGSIAILEIPKELERKEKTIAKELLKLHKHFRTVAKKVQGRQGKYRTSKLKVIAGEKNLVADYKESGCSFKVSLGKVYFSPRLSAERLRIAKQVKNGEKVGVFFAGAGPYCIVIAKHSKAEKIYGFEWNPKAVKDFEENIKRNKMQGRVFAVKGDVKKTAKKFKGFFDRIAMPAPQTSWSYLKGALASCKKKAIVHFYCFTDTEKPFGKALERLKKISVKEKIKLKVLSKKVVRPYSKKKCQIVLDLEVKK